ncbi:MAG: bifunctional diaminohydroxyphosphoribosylaminopyrimidine deaminase/5-amino-6-(5-phosphoribosylamino)uracil reductase RibD [Myxococcota bacterium]|nr:bifunctional diaminohydroxyphosphoribosylaminopyrimidine deaminase/5-amino-6-(5-phosphoribosylamino)uracil reductase RibD [Myxococcota bacterium]
MRQALAQARRALGRTWPNPAVGAVVVRGGRVLGRGFTQPPPGPHAEVVALERAARRHGRRALRGASLAVTLEPCRHHGRTPPCADTIRAAGIRRVWIGHRDPHPLVAGGGLRALRRAGIEVREGVLGDACREQHRGFLSRVERGRPHVLLKLAASLDGRIATASGESRWVTGPEARAAVHALRARSDAVLVGSGTARADDPVLTARRGGRVVHRPVRVVVDSRLRLAPEARLLRGPDPERTWVLCGRDAPAARRRALEAAGARLLPVPTRRGKLSLPAALRRLAREGLGTVLVEGGGGLAAALWQAGLVDELLWFVAPKLLGADGRPALGPLGLRRLRSAPSLEIAHVRRVGCDWLVTAHPAKAGREGR